MASNVLAQSALVGRDRLFGTFTLPADAREMTIGIDDPRYDTGRPFHELFVFAGNGWPAFRPP